MRVRTVRTDAWAASCLSGGIDIVANQTKKYCTVFGTSIDWTTYCRSGASGLSSIQYPF